MGGGTPPQIVRLYERAIDACQTENQRNACHIALGNRLTPIELLQLAAWGGVHASFFTRAHGGTGVSKSSTNLRLRRLAFANVNLESELIRRARRLQRILVGRNTTAHTRQWLLNLSALCELTGDGRVQPFTRTRVSTGVHLYSAGPQRKGKALVAVFAPYTNRPGMPMPAFLQLFDAGTIDVVLLTANRARGYVGGIPGLGGDLMSSCLALSDVLPLSEYRSVATVGASVGGLPSIIGAYSLQAKACMASGAVFKNDALLELLANVSSISRVEPEVTLLFSRDHVRDRESAHRFAEMCGNARLVELPGRNHNGFYELLKEGRLASFAHEALSL